jgi:hypothetical protein
MTIKNYRNYKKPLSNSVGKNYLFIFLGIIAVYCSSALYWIIQGNGFFSADSAEHCYYSWLGEKSIFDFDFISFKWLIKEAGYYSPFPYLLNGCFSGFFNTSAPDTTMWALLNLIYAVLTLTCSYFIAKRFLDQLWALVAILVLCGSPIFFALSRIVMLDMLLCFFITLSVFLLLANMNFMNRWLSLLTGLVAGFGFLVKFTFIIFFIGPLAVCLYTIFKNRFKIKAQITNFVLFISTASIICLPWVIIKLHKILNSNTLMESGPIPLSYGFMVRLWYYFIEFNNSYEHAIFWCIIFTCFAIHLFKKKLWFWITKEWVLLFSWIIIPLIFFSFLPNKDHRHLFPVIIPIVIFGTSLIREIRSQRFGIVTVLIFSGLFLIGMAGNLFDIPRKEIGFDINPYYIHLAPTHMQIISGGGYVGRYNRVCNQIQSLKKANTYIKTDVMYLKSIIWQATQNDIIRFNTLLYPFFYLLKTINPMGSVRVIEFPEKVIDHLIYFAEADYLITDASPEFIGNFIKAGPNHFFQAKLLTSINIQLPQITGDVFLYKITNEAPRRERTKYQSGKD